jgi:predicted DsbA family dithiol-disulfide isomerase
MLSQPDVFTRFATQLDLDLEAFTVCTADEDETHVTAIVEDYRAAQALGIRGTPAFFINGRPVSGAQPYQVFAGIIQEELEANGAGEISTAPDTGEPIPAEDESLS